MRVVSRIEERIKESGYRTDYISKQLGVSHKTIYNWKKGISYPTFETAFLLAHLLKCSVNDLAELKE